MKSSRLLVSRVLIALCALGAVACNDSNPTPTPSPSSSNGTSGTGGTTAGSGSSPGSVLTQHNDGYRTGQNLNETILTPSNVNSTSFGKIGALPVGGAVYAQPLVAPAVPMADGTQHDVLYVVDENDDVYAYDADTLSTTPLWQRSMLGDADYTCPNYSATVEYSPTNPDQVISGPCSVWTPADTGAPNISPQVGITSTPVIDQTAGVMYLVAAIKDATGLLYWELHGLSLSTGKEIAGSPVTIEGSMPGEGYGTDGTTDQQIHFAARYQLSRAGLVLNNGLVYVAMTSWNDQEPTHGWLFAYDESTMEPVSAFITTPNTGDGTIWQGGGAPAIDESGNIFFATGNGDGNAVSASNRDLSDSVLKINFGDDGFELEDYFTPYNYVSLAANDVDLGSGGAMLIPDQLGADPDLMVAAGKEGTVYLLNRDNLGQFTSTSTTTDTQIVQELPLVLTNGVEGKNYGTGQYGTPAYFQNQIFYAAVGDALRSIPLTNGQLDSGSMSVSPIPILGRGASPSISANGNANGIVWYVDDSAYSYTWTTAQCTDADPTACFPPTVTQGPAILYAYSTDDLSTPLYASSPAIQTTSTTVGAACGSSTVGTGQICVGSTVETVGATGALNPPSGTTGPSYVGPASDAAGDAVKFAVPTIVNGKVFVATNTEISVYGLRNSQVAQNDQRERQHEKEDLRSMASILGLGGDSHPAPAVTGRAEAPFDFFALQSPYKACSMHIGAMGNESSLY